VNTLLIRQPKPLKAKLAQAKLRLNDMDAALAEATRARNEVAQPLFDAEMIIEDGQTDSE